MGKKKGKKKRKQGASVQPNQMQNGRRPKQTETKYDSRAVIRNINIESLPTHTFYGDEDIIPYGKDNLYPQRILKAIKGSPTARGCMHRFGEFVFGHGITTPIGEEVVNRDGESLNDILYHILFQGYAPFSGFALHLNFNLLGEIIEISSVDLSIIRKKRDEKTCQIGKWEAGGNSSFLLSEEEDHVLDLYGKNDPIEGIKRKGIKDYKGQIFYFCPGGDFYPESFLQACIMSAEFESDLQLQYASNVKNGFASSGIYKYVNNLTGKDMKDRDNEVEKMIRDISGPGASGSIITEKVTMSRVNTPAPFKAFEPIGIRSVDGLYKITQKQAEQAILKTAKMPDILLGVSNNGLFNTASFADAKEYKNEDTAMDRKIISRVLNKIKNASKWANFEEISITPLGTEEKTTKTGT